MPTDSGKHNIRGVHRSSSQPNVSKALKRDFNLVSPTSPENQITLSNFRSLLQEAIGPVTADLNQMKVSLQFASNKLNEIKALSKKVVSLEKENVLLKENLDKADKRCEMLEERLVSMETFSRCNNIKFLNIRYENNENCELLILEKCKQHGIPVELKRH